MGERMDLNEGAMTVDGRDASQAPLSVSRRRQHVYCYSVYRTS